MSLPYRIRVPLQAIKKRSRPPSDSALITEETWTAAATPKYLQHILTSKVYDVAQETPLQLMTGMSKTLQNKIYLKREDMQPGFSFKIRGAYNKLAHLSLKEKQKGIVTYGTSNQAWSATLAASKLGIQSTVVMPIFTSMGARTLLTELGAEVIISGSTLEETMLEAMTIKEESGKCFLSPYDDPAVIAGQGTIGLEIINQLGAENLDAIFCCVGGGGLLSGVAAYVKAVCPAVRVIGVEAQGAEAMTLSLQQGQRVELPHVSTFAECAAVKQVGEECFRICNELVDDMVVVTNDELCAAIENTFEETRSMLEPAGALGLAGAKKYIMEQGLQGGSFVAITSGANVKFDRLRFVADRALIGQKKEALLSVTVPEESGSFKKLYSMVYPRSVTELSYRHSPSAQGATIFLAFELNKPGSDEVDVLVDQLQMAGMEAMDLTTDEMAKAHARYMSGGRANQDPNERVFRFEFPETPGALRKFLDCLKDDWNVTLFHYRSHGADKGKVLAGLVVPEDQEEDFQEFLTSLNYPYQDETENPVFKSHLW